MTSLAELLKESDSGSTFVRLKDGEKVVGVFCGEPVARKLVWVDGKPQDFDPTLHRERPSLRIMYNFYDLGAAEMRIFEMSFTVAKSLELLAKKYGLDKSTFEITRSGSGTDTKYHMLFDDKISKQLAEEIHATEMHDIKKVCGMDIPF